MYPYNDPSQQQGPFPQAGFPGVQEPVGGPLAGFQHSYAEVMQGAAPQGIRVESQPEAWARGAAIGFGSWLVWQRMKRRHQAKGEYTHPFFRFLLLWWIPMLIGFGLSMIWIPETGYFLGLAFVVGTVVSLAYLVYRAAGGGSYNTRKRGSPWRQDHQRGGR